MTMERGQPPAHPEFLEFLIPHGEQGQLISVPWQNGPVREVGINGVQAPEVLDQVLVYLRAVNAPPYNSRETSLAITDLESAQNWLNRRTAQREARGVEGTSAV